MPTLDPIDVSKDWKEESKKVSIIVNWAAVVTLG